MQLIEFPEQTVVIAKDQPEYLPMPAHIDTTSPKCETTICWQFTWRERLKVLFIGRVWHQIWTFGGPMQPQRLSMAKPTMKAKPAPLVEHPERMKAA